MARTLDAHVHLWPASAANLKAHVWMHSDNPLTRQSSTREYLAATSSDGATPRVAGFVYVETDRRTDPAASLEQYVDEPMREVAFVRRAVEGTPADEDERREFAAESAWGGLLKATVLWAPIDRGAEGMRRWLEMARKAAGEETWRRVKGFRYLLQGVTDEDRMKSLVLSEDCLAALRVLGTDGFAFDVGVNMKGVGAWQVEVAADMISAVREIEEQHGGAQMKFVLDHLCKPDLEQRSDAALNSEEYRRWKAAMERLALFPAVYIKLSGSFSELHKQDPSDPRPAEEVVAQMKPWIDVVFGCFTPDRIMFGSDWPVCNVRGPGDEHSWSSWYSVVERLLTEYGIDAAGKDRIWGQTAAEAYSIGAW